MPLVSRWFRENARLQTCLVSDPAHVVTGDSGDHVTLIQEALQVLDGAEISPRDLTGRIYGSSTAAAVLFKKKRGIVNRAYQTAPDNIVGKMTIRALHQEIAARERQRSSLLLAFKVPRQPLGSSSRKATRFPASGRARSKTLTEAFLKKRPSPGATPEQAVRGTRRTHPPSGIRQAAEELRALREPVPDVQGVEATDRPADVPRRPIARFPAEGVERLADPDPRLRRFHRLRGRCPGRPDPAGARDP